MANFMTLYTFFGSFDLSVSQVFHKKHAILSHRNLLCTEKYRLWNDESIWQCFITRQSIPMKSRKIKAEIQFHDFHLPIP